MSGQNVAVYMAHPYLDLADEIYTFEQHEINKIYNYLRNNKVILRSMNYGSCPKHNSIRKRKLVNTLVQKDEFFAKTYEFASRLRQGILEMAKTLTENGIDIIFIKSISDVPLDSDNFDVLVKEQDLTKAKEILEKSGFTEVARVREYEWQGPPHKWLYRRVNDNIIISIHLHTQVAWEGVNFIDSDDLWREYRETKIDNVKIGFPSPEHHLLITVAHAFFENQCLKLCDLIYIAEALQPDTKMDWNYIADRVVSDHWFKPFYAFLRLADHVYESLIGERLVKQDVYNVLARKGEIHGDSLAEKLIDRFNKEKSLPMKIQITTVAFSFVNKVFKNPGRSPIEKTEKLVSLGWCYIKKRIPLRREVPTLLVCFSGPDGTGKTTHSKCLRNELIETIHLMNDKLVEREFRVNYVWSRGIGLSIEPLMRIIRRLLLGSNSSGVDKHASKRKRLLKREPIRTIWAYVMLADELLQLLIKVKIPLLLRQMVLCDRYIYDVLVDIKCDLGKKVSRIIEKIIEDLAPKPEIIFFIDTEPIEIMRRRKGLKLNSVRCKRCEYLSYSLGEKFVLIDANKGLQQNKKEIMSSVLEALLL